MGCASSKAVSVSRIAQQTGFFDKYELADVLGRGAYGTVHLAHIVNSEEQFAVKVMDLKVKKDQQDWPGAPQLREDVRAERSAWARIGEHPNVVGLRESFIEHRFAYFVMELCSSSLFHAWTNEPHLNEFTYAPYFRDMARSVAHIHSVGVVHRDVKQDNFMVGGPDGRTVKLCDFGLSAVIPSGESLTGAPGTLPYMAPEMFKHFTSHGPPADVWSLGVNVYMSFFGCWPYRPRPLTKEAVKRAIRDGHPLPSFTPARRFRQNVISQAGVRFVRELLDRNTGTRRTAASCLQMAYFDLGSWEQLQGNGTMARAISLSPQLNVAKELGAFTVGPPTADANQELELMQLQGAAMMRRESTAGPQSNSSTAGTSDDAAAIPVPHQVC